MRTPIRPTPHNRLARGPFQGRDGALSVRACGAGVDAVPAFCQTARRREDVAGKCRNSARAASASAAAPGRELPRLCRQPRLPPASQSESAPLPVVAADRDCADRLVWPLVARCAPVHPVQGRLIGLCRRRNMPASAIDLDLRPYDQVGGGRSQEQPAGAGFGCRMPQRDCV